MKKFFLAMLSTVVCSLVSWAQLTEEPAQFYMVGTPNTWDISTAYVIADVNGDGVYDAEFDFPAGSGLLEFKLFSATPDWNDSRNVWGTTDGPIDLYSDRIWQIYMTSDASVMAGSNNIKIPNWQGGKLKMRIELMRSYDNTLTPRLTLWGEDQPEAGERPAVAVAGEFNGWSTTESPLELTSETSERYYGSVNIPAGKGKFKITATKEGATSWYGVDYPAFTLSTGTDGSANTANLGLKTTDDSTTEYCVELHDWAGGVVDIHVDFRTNLILVSSFDAPVCVAPSELYAIVTSDGESTIEKINLDIPNYIYFSTYLTNPSVIFTTENSLTPAPENVWGFAENSTMTQAEVGITIENFTLVKGGKPMQFDYPGEEGECISGIELDWELKTACCVSRKKNLPNSKLYMIGSLQGWDINDGSLELTKVSEGIFEGEFFVPANTDPLSFRFYSSLGNWDEDSFGSQYFDEPIGIAEPYTGEIVNGKGSWYFYNWGDEAAYLCVKVNLNSLTVEFTKKALDGITSATADGTGLHIGDGMATTAGATTIEVYTATGARVRTGYGTALSLQGMPAGIYIVRAGTSAVKVTL